MDAQSQSEARDKGATGPAGSAAPTPAQRPAAPPKEGFSTAQILVMAASGCVTALAVLILIVLAGDPTLGTVPPLLVATPTLPRITAAIGAPLRALPPPPAPSPTDAPVASAPPPAPPPPATSPPSLSGAPAPSPSISPLLPTRPARTGAPPPAAPPAPPPPATPTQAAPPQSNPGPLFQREN